MISIMHRESFEMIAKLMLLRGILAIFLLLIGATTAQSDTLDDFATASGLRHIREFRGTVMALHHHDGLPRELYVTKREARGLGWRPGDDICPWLGGRMIGGDRFDNRERALPDGQTYHEADLEEEDCGHRGPKRLIYDESGDIWMTVDHYQSFQKVP